MRKLIAAVFDDLDAADGVMTEVDRPPVQFGWEGRWYELDLTTAHALELEKLIAPYVKAGTVLTQPPKKGHANRAQSRAYYRGLRDWADEHGLPYTRADPAIGKQPYYPVHTRHLYAQHLARQGATRR